MSRLSWAAAAALAFAPAAFAQSPFAGWQAGAALDLSWSSDELALGSRDRGLALGHSDVTVSGPLGAHLQAQATAAIHTHERKLEGEIEEAWVQTRSLPAGLQLRIGRFASQVGYLNEHHPHADDFVQRPLLHRAFFGGHWNDDGVRLNWTAPTDLYLRLGVEVFRGRRLVHDAAAARRPGAAVIAARLGGDVGDSHSWQAGLSYLRNRREAAVEAHAGEDDADHEHGHEEEAHHGAHGGHGAAFSGARMWLADLTWKWAPGGNNAGQQLRVAYEHAVVRGLNRYALGSDRHQAAWLSVVWRFAPAWEAGVRADVLRARQPHETHFDDARLGEAALMLAYKPTHAQTVRVQLTGQRDRGGFDAAATALQLQYILNFGTHAAHAF